MPGGIYGGMTLRVDSREAAGILTSLENAIAPMALVQFHSEVTQDYLQRRAAMRFRGEGDEAVGGKWTPLAQHTVFIRANRGFGPAHPINKRTGELENYIVRGGEIAIRGEGEAVFTLPRRSGNRELQQKLSTAQRGRDEPPTVARPVVGMNMTDMEALLVGLGGWITAAVERRRFG